MSEERPDACSLTGWLRGVGGRDKFPHLVEAARLFDGRNNRGQAYFIVDRLERWQQRRPLRTKLQA
jgi:hypothetical protein